MIPAQYWRAKVWYPDFSVDYLFVDTNFLDALPPDADPEHNLCSMKHNSENGTCGPAGPESAEECPRWFSRLWSEQLVWMDNTLAESTAEWQIVVTHFPPTWASENWTYMVAKHGIDLFICGHVHQQHLHHSPELAWWIVSGGGGGITSEGTPDENGDDDMYGFMDLTLSKTTITVEAISHGGKLRSTTRIHPWQPPTTSTTSTVNTTSSTSTRNTSLTESTTPTTTSASSSQMSDGTSTAGIFTTTVRKRNEQMPDDNIASGNQLAAKERRQEIDVKDNKRKASSQREGEGKSSGFMGEISKFGQAFEGVFFQ